MIVGRLILTSLFVGLVWISLICGQGEAICEKCNVLNASSGNDIDNIVREIDGGYSVGTTNALASAESQQVWGVLHSIHTTYSDGAQSPANRPGILKQNYGWASTVDHVHQLTDAEWTSTLNEANTNNADGSYTYFPGYEWNGNTSNSLGGNPHATVFFPTNYPANLSNHGNDTLGLLAAFLQSNGALGCINHPSESGRVVDWTDQTVNSPYLPCVEILNKDRYHWSDRWECAPDSGCTTYNNPKPSSGIIANGIVRKALNNGFHLGFVAGWDNHGTGSLPTAYTGLVLDSNPTWTKAGIADVIKSRHTWAAEEKIMMDVHATANSTNYTMGDQFSVPINSLPVNYNFTASTGNLIASVNVFYNGIIVKSIPVSSANVSGTYSQSLRNGVEDYIFFEVIQNNSKRAWSSPMYVTALSTCTPTNCSTLGYNCGSWPDGCGGSLNCGMCSDGYTCTNGVCTCQPKPCSVLGYNCGIISDGCGGTLNCGTCPTGQTCSNGKCIASCTPKTCRVLGYNCGTTSDGCGGTLNCGTCRKGQTCSNGKCIASCTPKTCSALGYNCGKTSDGCGGTLNCGTCRKGQTCNNGVCVQINRSTRQLREIRPDRPTIAALTA